MAADIFNVQTLRAIAFLYKNETPADLQPSTLLGPGETPSGAERGIILWLYDNGHVLGDLVKHDAQGADETTGVTSARLSGRCRRMLEKPHQTESEITWGQFTLANAFGEGERAAAALLMQRLLDE